MDSQIVAINTWRSATPEKIHSFLDNGNFVNDLGERGLTLAVTNIDSFNETGPSIIPAVVGGQLTLTPQEISPTQFGAIYSRVVPPHKYLDDDTLVLNSNPMKRYAASKHRMYEDVLSTYQTHTELISVEEDTFDAVTRALDALSADELVVKSDAGSGSKSTRIVDREQLITHVEAIMAGEKPGNLVIQSKIDFGPLPDGVKGVSVDNEELVQRARQEGLLSEVRMFTVKSGDTFRCVPVLRVVTQKGDAMGSPTDSYVDVRLDEELGADLRHIAEKVVTDAAVNAGDVKHVLAAVDFYFDKDGRAKIMEVNMRSPELPVTSRHPHSGRLVHQAVASTLAEMVQGPSNDARQEAS